MCAAAIEELYGTNDECANAVRQLLLASDINAVDTISAIPGCQERFQATNDICLDAVSNDTTFINDTDVSS